MGQRFSRALGRDPNFVDLRPPRGPKNLPHCALNTLLCLKCGPYQGEEVFDSCAVGVFETALLSFAVWVPNNAISGQGWDAIKEFERINRMNVSH